MDRVCDLHPCKKIKRIKTAKGEMVSFQSVSSSLSHLQAVGDRCRLRLNIGGIYFEILQKNLARFPDTLLGGDRKQCFYDETRNEYFFDRDPVTFKHILDFYRTGKFHISTPDCMELIRDELDFFGIPEAYVSECCCEHISFEKEEEETTLDRQKNLPQVYGGKEKLYEFLTDFNSSIAAAIFSYFFVLVVIINIGLIVGETLDCEDFTKCGHYYKTFFFVVDSFCVAVFTFEFFARLFSCPDRLEFMKDYTNLVDLIGILPYYFGIVEKIVESNNVLLQSFITIFRIFRIFRVIKLARHSEQFQNLLLSIAQAGGELGGILFSFLALMVMFSTVIFAAEEGGSENPNGFTSIPSAFWYTLVTMTTLGYGDMVPSSFVGKLIGSACALAGVVLLALPVPIIEEKLNDNAKKLNRKKEERGAEGMKLTKRLAASIASIKNLSKRVITQASQSSITDAMESCNEVQTEMKSSSDNSIDQDSSSDETLKASFTEMNDLQLAVQVHEAFSDDRNIDSDQPLHMHRGSYQNTEIGLSNVDSCLNNVELQRYIEAMSSNDGGAVRHSGVDSDDSSRVDFV